MELFSIRIQRTFQLVSTLFVGYFFVMKLNNNDDSHNSGLNLLIYNMLLDIESHPAWVCGLKRLVLRSRSDRIASHPAWVCGLKRTQVERRAMSISHTLRGCVD